MLGNSDVVAPPMGSGRGDASAGAPCSLEEEAGDAEAVGAELDSGPDEAGPLEPSARAGAVCQRTG